MPKKLKIILGVLVLAAGFLIIRVGSSFYRSVKTAALISQIITTPTPEENSLTKDSDGDGISDRDEIIYATDPFNKDSDGDGYWDGEEITTGFDPLNPFDHNGEQTVKGLSIISKKPNLTDKLLNITMASLVNDTGELDPTEMTDAKYADILQSINNDAVMMLLVQPPMDSDIKIIDDNSVKTIQKYLRSTTAIIEEEMFFSPFGLKSQISDTLGISSDYSSHYQNIYNSLQVIEVPSSWKEIHKAVLTNFSQLSKAFDAIAEADTDPVRASFAVSQIQDSFLQMPNLLNQATRLAEQQNIPIQDSILRMINSADSTLPK